MEVRWPWAAKPVEPAAGSLLRCRDLLLRRHQKREVRRDPFALSFIRSKEECLVLDDRPAKRRSELIVAEFALLDMIANLIRGTIEVIARIKYVISQEFKG